MTRGALVITTLDRVRLGYDYETDIVFTIIISNSIAPSKASKTINFVGNFARPRLEGTHRCPKPAFNRSSTRISSYNFDITNVTDFDLTLTTDNCNSSITYQFNYYMIDFTVKNIT